MPPCTTSSRAALSSTVLVGAIGSALIGATAAWFAPDPTVPLHVLSAAFVLGTLVATRLGFWAVERDAHLREELEQLRRAEAAAVAANGAKSVFLAKMSHELRTPLTTILGYAHLLEEPLAASPALHDLRQIRRAANRLTDLVDDVLDIARLETGGLDLTAEPFDITALVREVLMELQPSAEAKGLAVFSDLSPGEYVHADRRRTAQVLTSLVANAVRFTAYGGVHVDIQARGPLLVVHVQDTGCGMTTDEAANVFHRFGTDSMSPGGGLGLSIARELAEAMGGDLTVVSEPRRGSTFTLTLPRYTVRRDGAPTPRRVSIH